MRRMLITGATGQIGTELIRELRRRHGDDQVIASSCDMPSDDARALIGLRSSCWM